MVFKESRTKSLTQTRFQEMTPTPLNPSEKKITALKKSNKPSKVKPVKKVPSLNTIKIQKVTVTGLVLDETEEPMIGVTIFTKDNTGVGTVTDFDGTFSLDIPSLNEIS